MGMPHRVERVLLVVNLGTPDDPTPASVRRYLAEFLADRRVVDIPPAVWKPILHGMVLPLRGPRSARLYAKVWTTDGSPLLGHTRRLAEGIAARLPGWTVIPAMTYGQPSLTDTLARIRTTDVDEVVVLPLYPHYSTTTTASVEDRVEEFSGDLPITFVTDYSDDSAWLAAVADTITAARSQDTERRHLLFSFHGLPQKVADGGDPYPSRCRDSAREIADRLGLGDDEWSMAYQSRFGPAPWLQPATTDELDRLTRVGIDEVDVVCPGFAVDCLETLEEIAIRLREQYEADGGALRYIPCLNDAPEHADVLADVVLRATVDHPSTA